jgi:hypothetical protein
MRKIKRAGDPDNLLRELKGMGLTEVHLERTSILFQ